MGWNVIELIGWAGAALFAVAGLPQAWQCAQDGHARGLNWMFLLAWLGGQTLTLISIWDTENTSLKANYAVNYVFLLMMIRYKFKERK